MALLKSIELKSGVSAEYWKMTDWNLNMSSKALIIQLSPYFNQEKKDAGCMPFFDEIKLISCTDLFDDHFSPLALDQSEVDIYKIMYTYIKDHVPEFEGATDI